MNPLLRDIGLATIAATLLGLVASRLRQPIVLAYLVAGALLGPIGLGLIEDRANIETIGELGLVLLLFVIGLEMNLKEALASGRQLLLVGLGQFPLGVLLGVGCFGLLGYGLTGHHADGLYLALVCGLSSTAIVVKLLYDKCELDTLAGRLTVGVLVIQDLFAILVLACQPSFSTPSPWPVLRALGGTALLVALGFGLSRYVLSRVCAAIANSPEMVVAVSLGWCAAVAGTAAALGLSKEMGALIAGLAVSAFPYRLHVTAKVLPLRDFFLTLFFVSLGLRIVAPDWRLVGGVALVVAFTLVSRFATVWPLLAAAGAGPRTAFVTSLNLAQLSEFGLVIATLGVAHQHLAAETLMVILYATAFLAVLSSYSIRYSHELYGALERLWRRPLAAAAARVGASTADTHPVVVLGLHRAAWALLDELAAHDPELLRRVLVIDYNLENLEQLQARGVAGHFGDIGSLDTLRHAHLPHARVLISSIPDMLLQGTDNATLVRHCRALAPAALILATAESAAQAAALRLAGATEVVQPYQMLGAHLSRVIAQLEPRPAAGPPAAAR